MALLSCEPLRLGLESKYRHKQREVDATPRGNLMFRLHHAYLSLSHSQTISDEMEREL